MTDRTDSIRIIDGWVAPGFEPVREAFEINFTDHGELGAAFAATLHGAPVVDLWGGIANSPDSTPWTRDTLQVVFSGTKGLVATCVLMLADRGLIDVGAPVATYWPEFAANGKADVTIAEVMSHKARLPAVRTPLRPTDLADGRRLAELLAAQPQETDARAATAYHGLTYGWLAGELVRRVDGRTVGRFLQEEVAGPLDLETWIGLPPELEGRVAQLARDPGWLPTATDDMFDRDDLLRATYQNPGLHGDEFGFNSPAFHQCEMPGANGISTARSMARFYGCLAGGGELDGTRLLRTATLELGLRPLSDRHDALQGDYHHVFAVGFQLQNDSRIYGPPADAFGHSGAGGSIHCAWPTQGIGVSYAMNLMRNSNLRDPRSISPMDALFDCLPQ
jgi:CubicO group peptidase (beta-lactamase class C family)